MTRTGPEKRSIMRSIISVLLLSILWQASLAQSSEPSGKVIEEAPVPSGNSAPKLESHTPCHGDTVFYEDFSNGFSGANSHGIGWDTSGTYQAWRECSSLCPTNGSNDISGAMSSPTQSNGVAHLDIQWKAGYTMDRDKEPGIYMVRLRDPEGKDAVIRLVKE